MFRLLCYYDLAVLATPIVNITVDAEIPLYCSEIVMAILIIYMLVSTSFTGEDEGKLKENKPKK